jgi:diguanylate cyclase (GGDEF)-like protein
MLPTLDHLAEVPAVVWLWGAVLLFVASGLGLAMGVWHERGAPRRAVNDARRSLSKLIALTTQRMESARDTCGLLEQTSRLDLSDSQVEMLERLRGEFTQSIGRVFERRAAEAELRRLKSPREPFTLEWIRLPADEAGFPTNEAFDQSLAAMLAAGRRAECSSALLLVKVDRVDALQQRFGATAAERLTQKLGGVLSRALRDDDLVCRTGDDTFAVLIPQVESEEGHRLAEAVRSTVRQHHFRLEESGEEILVTANFGYAACDPFDNADLVLNRAGDALARSMKRGRNQLHTHDGRMVAVVS